MREPLLDHDHATPEQQLEVSASGLRRLASAYEAVFDALPREPGTPARGYPAEAVERIRTARRGVELGQFKSTQAALYALKKGVAVDAEERAGMPGAGAQAVSERQLEALVSEMQAMRAEVERLRVVVEDRDRLSCPRMAPGRQESTGCWYVWLSGSRHYYGFNKLRTAYMHFILNTAGYKDAVK